MENTMTEGLTKYDLKALKTCSYVNARHTDGESCLEVMFEDPTLPVNGKREIKTMHRFRIYGHGYRPEMNKKLTCFSFRFGMGKCDEVWQTILHFLKVGDVLTLEWGSDGNQYLKAASHDGRSDDPDLKDVPPFNGLYRDSLSIVVERKGKEFKFLVDTSICPNNSARMIRGL